MLTPTEVNNMTETQLILEAISNDEVTVDTDDLLVNLVGQIKSSLDDQAKLAGCRDYLDPELDEIREQLVNLWKDAQESGYDRMDLEPAIRTGTY